MIRIGIVGTGMMAAGRLKALRASGRAQVAAVFSRSLEKGRTLAEGCGAQAYDRMDKMLGEVDAVVVCTPNPTHADFGRAALEAGKACLVEYPLCTDMSQAKALAAASEGAGTPLMVGNTIIHEETFKYIQANKRKFGKPLTASSRVTFRSDELKDAWYMKPELRGPFAPSVAYHHAEFLKRVVGPVASANYYDDSSPDPDRPGYCTHVGGTLVMQHENGAASATQWYLFAHGSGETRGMWVTGEDQSLTVTMIEDKKHEMRWSDGTIEYVTETDWGISGSCGDFIDAIEGRLDWHARLAEDMDTLRITLELPA